GLAADKGKAGEHGAPAMADKLTFTTTVDSTATPKVVFAPAKTGFQITDTSLTGGLRRTDTHQVTVGLGLATKKGLADPASLSGFVFSGAGLSGPRVAVRSAAGNVLVLNRVTARATSLAQQYAIHAVDQLKSREVQLIPPPP